MILKKILYSKLVIIKINVIVLITELLANINKMNDG